jgi:hypothetical protein
MEENGDEVSGGGSWQVETQIRVLGTQLCVIAIFVLLVA